MVKAWWIAAAAALVLLVADGPAVAQQPAPKGCLATGDCGHKGTRPGARRDYWYNWVCQGCHTGPFAALAPSPQEIALMQIPLRFWTMHTRAERDAETRMRAHQYGLKPLNRLAPPFRTLVVLRPKNR